jgi:hypothetical protein
MAKMVSGARSPHDSSLKRSNLRDGRVGVHMLSQLTLAFSAEESNSGHTVEQCLPNREATPMATWPRSRAFRQPSQR